MSNLLQFMFLKKTEIVFILLGLFTLSCNQEKKAVLDLPPLNIEVIRFDSLFYKSPIDSLYSIKRKFPYFFPNETPDHVWSEKQQDSLQLALVSEINRTFPTSLEEELKSVIKHYKYYFPKQKIPQKVITLVSEVDLYHKVIDADSLILISIDTFLGAENHLYEGVSSYLKKNMTPAHLTPSIAEVLASRVVPKNNSRSFLSEIIYYGKIHFVMDYLAPSTPDYIKLGFTFQELDWVENNEQEMWRYFVDRELLYSTDPNLTNRFIREAPFSKFYLDIDRESPGGVGRWLGWRIVSSYANTTNKSLVEIIESNPIELFKQSKYKPFRK